VITQCYNPSGRTPPYYLIGSRVISFIRTEDGAFRDEHFGLCLDCCRLCDFPSQMETLWSSARRLILLKNRIRILAPDTLPELQFRAAEDITNRASSKMTSRFATGRRSQPC
jgi:hypothetical protein